MLLTPYVYGERGPPPGQPGGGPPAELLRRTFGSAQSVDRPTVKRQVCGHNPI